VAARNSGESWKDLCNRMADPPRLTKLGAKWVEVRKRRDQGFREWHDEGVLKRGQQHPLSIAHFKPEGVALNLSELLL
jgi:hypothetical protein